MANTLIQIKSSGVSGNVPTALQTGELAINYADGKLYYGNASNTSVLFDAVTEPAGLDGEIQYNSSGSFGASSSLRYFSGNNTLSATTVKSNTIITPYGSLAEAFDKANLAFFTANALTGGTAEDGIARTLANTAYVFAGNAFNQANLAYAAANNAVDTWVRTQANTAYDKANAAYDFANNIVSTGGAGFNKIKVGGTTLTSAANSEIEIKGEGLIQVAADATNPLSITVSALAGAQGMTVDWGWISESTGTVTYDFGAL